jgi:hypothetical protein
LRDFPDIHSASSARRKRDGVDEPSRVPLEALDFFAVGCFVEPNRSFTRAGQAFPIWGEVESAAAALTV